MKVNRVVTVVLDSVGVGSMPDADRFKDEGCNTLLHLFQQRGRLEIPNLCSLGLGKIVDIPCKSNDIIGCYGKMAERSPNKDTTSGHWELAGLVLESPFPTYPDGFPRGLIKSFEKEIGTKTLGNYPSSGTEILKELGEEHLKTGYPIVYTSADSVFQLAAHENVVPLKRLYEYCRIARSLLIGKHAVARVIARPFLGAKGKFARDNAARKDFSLIPSGETLLDILKEEGCFVVGVGKIGDIYGHSGLTEEIYTRNNEDGVDKVLESLSRTNDKAGLVFANLVDFDMVYGHRRNVEGYAKALEDFDRRIPQIMDALTERDVLMITADHGCDPTYQVHTDHTREYVPILVLGEGIKRGVPLGTRDTFADCGQTIADFFGAGPLKFGKSFKGDIFHGQKTD